MLLIKIVLTDFKSEIFTIVLWCCVSNVETYKSCMEYFFSCFYSLYTSNLLWIHCIMFWKVYVTLIIDFVCVIWKLLNALFIERQEKHFKSVKNFIYCGYYILWISNICTHFYMPKELYMYYVMIFIVCPSLCTSVSLLAISCLGHNVVMLCWNIKWLGANNHDNMIYCVKIHAAGLKVKFTVYTWSWLVYTI